MVFRAEVRPNKKKRRKIKMTRNEFGVGKNVLCINI